MFSQIMNNQFYGNLIDTGIAIFILGLAYFFTRLIISRFTKIKHKNKKKSLARLNYILAIFFLIIVAKIWINGFTHFFYALSLVSAGLVITNKETIMNFVGWVVITWRGLFSEGDYIKIGDNAGFVYELGLLYFRVLQSSPNFTNNISGKMVKIPNGLVITNPIINFSLSTNLIETTQKWKFTPDSDLNLAMELLQQKASSIIEEFYKDDESYTLKSLKSIFKNRINLDVNLKVSLDHESTPALVILICYYCFPKDKDVIESQLFLSIFNMLQQHEKLKLIFTEG